MNLDEPLEPVVTSTETLRDRLDHIEDLAELGILLGLLALALIWIVSEKS